MTTTSKGRKSIFDDALKQRTATPGTKAVKVSNRPVARVPARTSTAGKPGSGPPKQKKGSQAPASDHHCSRHKRPQCATCSKKPDPARTVAPHVANHGRRRQHKVRRPNVESALSRRMRSVGTRTNCFNAFPFPGDIDVDFAVDHLVTYLAPLIFGSYPKFGNPLITVAFPHALENPVMFGALVTFAQAHVDTLLRPDGKPSVESLMYWGKTVSLLRDKMSDPESCADDAAILSNIYLMGAAARFQEQEACNTFYLGLQRMVQIRGGLDKLGLDGYVKNCILYIDGLGLASDDPTESTSPPNSDSSMPTIPSEDSTPTATTTSERPLTYPSHPFPPDLCTLVAKLAPGFIDLAMQYYLSIELLRPLERLLYWAAQPGMVLLEHGPGEHLYDLRKVASRIPGPTKSRSKRNIEQVVCLAFMTLSIEIFTGIRGNRLNEARWRLVKFLVVDDFSSKGKHDAEGKLECELKAWFIIMASHAGTEDESAHNLDGQKINDVLMDRLLDDEASASNARGRAEFPYARRWQGPKGLRVVLARFFIDERLDKEWRACWRSHMERKGIPLHPDDDTEEQAVVRDEDDEDDEAAKAKILSYVRERSRLAFVDEQEKDRMLDRQPTTHSARYEERAYSQTTGGSQIELSLED